MVPADLYNKIPPNRGGTRTYYSASGINQNRPIIFVNGIMNAPEEHALSCQQIMNATGCSVLGIYNQKGTENIVVNAALRSAFVFENLSFDLGQCISDQVGLLARGGLGYTGNTPNGCTASLLNFLLMHGDKWPCKPISILAHSQGNLITSNALMQYSALMSGRAKVDDAKLNQIIAKGPKRIHVFAVASPAPTWPTNHHISVHSYWHTLDPVTGLSGYRNLRGTLKGQGTITNYGFGHSLDTYLDDKKMVDSICQFMGATSERRYEVAPEKFTSGWAYR
jgi:hypothetical protein